MTNQWTVFKKVLGRLKPHWLGLISSLILATVSVAMSLYIPILVGRAIDCIVEAENLTAEKEEVAQALAMVCRQNNMTTEQIKPYYDEEFEKVEDYFNDLLFNEVDYDEN